MQEIVNLIELITVICMHKECNLFILPSLGTEKIWPYERVVINPRNIYMKATIVILEKEHFAKMLRLLRDLHYRGMYIEGELYCNSEKMRCKCMINTTRKKTFVYSKQCV